MNNNSSEIHISAEVKVLSELLTKARGIIASKSALPILNDVLLAYADGKFTLTAAHPDGHRLTLDAPLTVIQSAEKQWQVCLPVADLLPAVKGLPQGGVVQLYIDRDKNVMRVEYVTGSDDSQQGGKFSLPIDNADEFPQPVALTPEQTQSVVEVKAGWLLPRVRAARVCIASDELRPQMGCVCVDADQDGGVTVVGSDGHSLLRDRLSVGLGSPDTPLKQGQPFTFLFHSSVLSTLCDVFSKADTIRIATDGHRNYCTAEGVSFVVTQIDAKYPNYNSVIPQQQAYSLTAETREIVGALRRVSLFANDSSNMAVLSSAGGNLHIEASDYDFSKAAEETVRLQDTNLPDGFKIGVKISTLTAVLGCVETENVVIRMSDPSRAMTLHNEDANGTLTCLVMPMLVND